MAVDQVERLGAEQSIELNYRRRRNSTKFHAFRLDMLEFFEVFQDSVAVFRAYDGVLKGLVMHFLE